MNNTVNQSANISVIPLSKILPLLTVLILLSGCSRSEPPLTPLTSNSTILAFGDSLTRGVGASHDSSYPAVLESVTGIRVVNAGIPGELSLAGLARLPELLEEYHPQLVILCHGGNDILRKRSLKDAKQNIRQMVMLAQQSGAEVVLIGVPEFGLLSIDSVAIYDELAEELTLPYEGEVLPTIVSDRNLKSDHVHPNGEGYRMMATAISQLLIRSGALQP